MDAASPASSIVSVLGGGSGIDMTALANNLAEAQFAGRIGRIENQSETLATRISLAGTLRSRILQLASALGERVRVGDLAPTPQIANAAVAAVSRPVGSTATGAGYSLEVTALASRQVVASPPLASATTPSGAGTLTLRLGTIENGALVEGTTPPVVLTIPPGATLGTVAAAINGSGTGVTAYVATSPDGARLVIKGKEGAASAFTLEASEDPAEPGLSALAWTPGASPERLLGSAGDALYKLDGLERSSASNSVADAAPGLALKLTATNTGAPTTISFSDPATAIGSAMQDLTSALNEIAGELAQATDPRSGALARDPGAQALRRQLSQLAGATILPTAADGAPRTLSELGLATNRDGTFRFDPAVLNRQLATAPEAVAAFFTPGLRGVFATVDRIARNASLVGDPGSLGGSVARYTALQSKLSDDRLKLDDQLETVRAQLIKRFSASDVRVGNSRSTLSFLQNQIDAWNAPRS